MDKTVRFETYSRIVPAIQYDGIFDSYAAINAFSHGRLHLRFGTEPAFMTDFGLVNLVKGDWVVEIAENRFITMKDEMRKAVFCPLAERGDLSDDTVDATVYALEHLTLNRADAERLTGLIDGSPVDGFAGLAETINSCAREYANQIGEDFARDGGEPMVPRFTVPEGFEPDLTPGSIVEDPLIRVFGIGDGTVDPDETMILIRPDHPHGRLINDILTLTGVSSWAPNEDQSLAKGQPYEVALVALKAGYRIAREGWNGKGMWLCLGDEQMIHDPSKFWNRHTYAFAEQRKRATGTSTVVLPYIIMKTADDKILMGWLASQTDQLANDWCILEN